MAALAAAALWGAVALGDTAQVVGGGVTLLPDAMEEMAYSVQLTAPEGVEEQAEWAISDTGFSAWMNARVDGFSPAGQPMGWQGDENIWPLKLPFAFPFYGQEYTEAWVGSNGTIEFGEGRGRLGYNVDEDTLKATVAIAAMWADLDTGRGDIFVATGPQWVEVVWKGHYYGSSEAVDVSARLYSDGRVSIMFGEGNARGGLVGVSGGEGFEKLAQVMRMEGEEMKDTVFAPFQIPAGLTFDPETHMLTTGSGVIGDEGTYSFGLTIDTGDEEPVDSLLALRVQANPAVRPLFAEWVPQSDTVNLAEGGEAGVQFSVRATTENQEPVNYQWLLDGEPVGSATRTYTMKAQDANAHTLVAEALAAGLKTSRHEWAVGVLRFAEQPEGTTVSVGQRAELKCDVEATGGASVTWYEVVEGGEDESVGSGTQLLLNAVQSTATYYAVAENAYGKVESARATVEATDKPSLGRIYKLTGPAFVGNRLVLRAKSYGALDRAEYTWTRDGKALPDSGERLEIASLKPEDFGTYRLLVRTPEYPSWTESEPFVLAPAESGAPLGWGASGHGRTTAPDGLTGVVDMESGHNFNVALTTNGTVAAWGYDGYGACDVPEGLTGVSSVAAGGYESYGAGFAVKTDGRVVGWGRAYEDVRYWDEYAHAEWDEETQEYRYSGDWVEYRSGFDVVGAMPEDLANVVKIAVGGELAVALRADGSVETWSRYGEVEDDPYEVPGEVQDVVDIAAGSSFALALLADGRVVAWGDEGNCPGCLDVPGNLGEAVAVAATEGNWSESVAFALLADGSVAKWGDQRGSIGDGSDEGRIGFEPEEARDVTAIDAGEEFLAALTTTGEVRVWCNYNVYGLRYVPVAVEDAIGVAAGGYHCTAVLRDTDGDSIPDTVEPLYGRDPQKWEDWHRTSLRGTVKVDGGMMMPEHATVSVYDASGMCLATAEVDEDTGSYEVEGLIPGRYFVFAAADKAADDWAGHVAAPSWMELPPNTAWKLGNAQVEVGLSALASSCDFDLAPGQANAWCQVVPLRPDPDSEFGEYMETQLPDGATVYLDMWPVETDDEGRFDLGEVAASHAVDVDGLALLPHIVTYKDPEAADGRPSPDNQVRGVEGYIVHANPAEVMEECAVRITTVPSGVEVWVDRADESLGTTGKEGLDVYGLAAGSHALLLRKDGYLRPRPIEFVVEPGETTDIDLVLHEEGGDVSPIVIQVSAGMPETPIYLDYLPTGLTTPARVGGMDPTEESGWNWRSVSHSILLRRDGSRPYAARVVPDDPGDQAWSIKGPNQYDDDDGDGVRNDREVSSGRDPSDGSNDGLGPVVIITNSSPGGVTQPIRVPVSWVAHRPGFHERFEGLDTPDARRARAREILDEPAANQEMSVYECYVMGLDPTDETSEFKMFLAVSNGISYIAFHPCFAKFGEEVRNYALMGVTNLLSATADPVQWGTVNNAGTDVGTINWSAGGVSGGEELPAQLSDVAAGWYDASSGTSEDGALASGSVGWVAVTNSPGGTKAAGAKSDTWFYRIGVSLPEEAVAP